MAIIDDAQSQLITYVNCVFLCSTVSLFGIVANVINLIVIYKQGLNSSINITFFALAISDLFGLLTQEWLNVCVYPLFVNSGLPIVPLEFQYLIAGIPRAIFSKITCLITVYATLERCLCIAFPLHVKRMITPRKATAVMICIYGMIFLSFSPLYYTISINWKFYPERNRTLIGLVFSSNAETCTNIVYLLQAFINIASFSAVVMLTTILIQKLAEKNDWRQSTVTKSKKAGSIIDRDRKTMILVALIAIILICCFTPNFILFIVSFVEPEFNVARKYGNLLFSLWSVSLLLESLNSSVNIFLYIKMSTKYRNTFMALCVSCTDIN